MNNPTPEDAEKRRYRCIVGRKILKLIKIRGCTYDEVAMAAGYTSNSMISQAISGDKLPSPMRLAKIADFFGIPEAYLSDDIDYDADDLRLIAGVHKMIRNKHTARAHPHYDAIKALLSRK